LERLKAGESNGKLPQELAQDAAYQSHTSRLTELWSLPKPAQGLNTYKNNKEWFQGPHESFIQGLNFVAVVRWEANNVNMILWM